MLCTLTIDTTGFVAGQEFALTLAWPDVPAESQFLLYGGTTLAASITNGTIRLQETEVVGRSTFYNNSHFDGYDAAINAADDAAIATDKSALRPAQQAAFANYTSFSRGLNGVMIDVRGLPPAASLADFTCKVGNTADPSTWPAAPAPSGFAIRPRLGTGGSDRIVITWADGAITGKWLQVTMRANVNTGLKADDVVYFGNAIGECGNSTTNAFVDGSDIAGARDNFRSFLNPATVTDHYDYNRDRFVDGIDMAIARDHATNFLAALRLLAPPVIASAAATGSGSSVSAKSALEEAGVRTIDNDSPGFAIMGGTWRVESATASSDSYRYHPKTATAGAVVSWTFTDLQPGKYLVYATWTGGANRSDRVQYTLYAPAARPLTVTVNQRTSPNGADQHRRERKRRDRCERRRERWPVGR